jgi:hypothetical protein
MPGTFAYTPTSPLTPEEIAALNSLFNRMSRRARNGNTTIASVVNWTVTVNRVVVSLIYNNHCDMTAAIKGALNKAVGSGRLN